MTPSHRSAPQPLRRRVAGLIQAWRWTGQASATLRRQLPESGLRSAIPPPPPGLPDRAGHLVHLALRVRRSNCLERSMVLQCWLLTRGRAHDVVIGVRRDDRLVAHAWLEHLEEAPAGFVEIDRLRSAPVAQAK